MNIKKNWSKEIKEKNSVNILMLAVKNVSGMMVTRCTPASFRWMFKLMVRYNVDICYWGFTVMEITLCINSLKVIHSVIAAAVMFEKTYSSPLQTSLNMKTCYGTWSHSLWLELCPFSGAQKQFVWQKTWRLKLWWFIFQYPLCLVIAVFYMQWNI